MVASWNPKGGTLSTIVVTHRPGVFPLGLSPGPWGPLGLSLVGARSPTTTVGNPLWGLVSPRENPVVGDMAVVTTSTFGGDFQSKSFHCHPPLGPLGRCPPLGSGPTLWLSLLVTSGHDLPPKDENGKSPEVEPEVREPEGPKSPRGGCPRGRGVSVARAPTIHPPGRDKD